MLSQSLNGPRDGFTEKLALCKENNCIDNTLPMIKCPQCNDMISSGVVQCTCGRKVKFCFKVNLNEFKSYSSSKDTADFDGCKISTLYSL